MLRYVADQIGAAPDEFALYARREETRRDHMARLMVYLDTRSATLQDRRVALLAAIQAATISDDGAAIASSAVILPFSRWKNSLRVDRQFSKRSRP